jgi:hypothetical protein
VVHNSRLPANLVWLTPQLKKDITRYIKGFVVVDRIQRHVTGSPQSGCS